MKTWHMLVGSMVGLGVLAGAETSARACGGCFHPPTETPTVVTDHRMIFAVSRDQATLYDQIQFTGSPSSFAWVLPFSGDITVGTSSDDLFAAIDFQTQTQIVAPAMNCPQPTNCGDDDDAVSFGGVPKNASANDDGVDVLKHEVVGPYETVQLKATDSDALQKWLADHGYALPDDVRPVVTAYQNEHFNFLAVKLVPGAGIQSMRPIRVTTKGSSVALPLRMVAAGTGATVGITLWIVGEGRYEPQTFPWFHIETSDIAWNWDLQKSDYTELRTQRMTAGNNAIWEVESSLARTRSQVETAFNVALSADHGYQAEGQDSAAVVESRDLDTLFAGLAGRARITRLRGDLAHAALDRDLVVAASADQSELSNVRNVTKESVEPLCPVYDDCDQVGTARRAQAISATNDNEGCATTQPKGRRSGWLELALAAVVIATGRRMRKEKDR